MCLTATPRGEPAQTLTSATSKQGLDREALYLLDDNGEDAAEASDQPGGSAPGGQNSSMGLNTAGKRGIVYGGGALMEAGLPVPLRFGEYLAYQWHFTRQ